MCQVLFYALKKRTKHSLCSLREFILWQLIKSIIENTKVKKVIENGVVVLSETGFLGLQLSRKVRAHN